MMSRISDVLWFTIHVTKCLLLYRVVATTCDPSVLARIDGSCSCFEGLQAVYACRGPI